MKFTRRVQLKAVNTYIVQTPEYLLGILHTYAHLNRPDTTLDYEYDLVALPPADALAEYLKTAFFIFENQDIRLVPVAPDTFKALLAGWFFNNGELAALKLNGQRQSREADHFYEILQHLTACTKISRIDNLDSIHETTYLELGIQYDYFIIHAATQNYLLYFRYDD